MAQHDVWFSSGADMSLTRFDLAAAISRSNDQRSANGGRGGPIAGRRPCRWRPSPWGGSARPAKTSTKPTPQVPFVRRVSHLLETPVPLLSQFPEREGGAPLFPEIFGYHSLVLGRK